VSADIIRFIPRAIRDRRPRNISHLFRFPARQADDLTMDMPIPHRANMCRPAARGTTTSRRSHIRREKFTCPKPSPKSAHWREAIRAPR